jgi:hypothetical protein
MKYGRALLVLFIGLAACRHEAAVPFVPDRIASAAPSRLNIVLYLSSCTPCGSLTFDGAAAFVRKNPQTSHLLVVVNRNATGAEDLLRERVESVKSVSFIRDTDGNIARAATLPSLPFLVIYDDRRHLLRAEAIAASSAARACLHDEITALYTVVPVS